MILEYVLKNALDSNSQTQTNRKRIDPQAKNLLVYLFTGTRGGINRLRIVLLLTERPRNAHQIAKALDLDYNSVEYHIPLLEKNNLILHEGKKYGTTYRLSSFLEYNIEAFNEIILELHKKCKENAVVTL
ncbi:MAG: winged helix-turn-helix transcriptional regulator [Thaumarchaeota archaeon]|nr:winged helix-turn-helix transcriptional regulator [Nitrososphaerota archaeon]